MNKGSKKILFLSALDFKEKSIQVIRITPEAYRDHGWKVTYLVARDNSPNGNYFYEQEISPKEIAINRFYWPLSSLRGRSRGFVLILLNKLAGLWVALRLFWLGRAYLKKENVDVIYGYETHGVLALGLLRLLGWAKESKTVSRFQGSFLNEMFENKQYIRLVFNWDRILAIRIRTDVLIMTDDGTQGDLAVQAIKKGQSYNFKFLVNGVDAGRADAQQSIEGIVSRPFMFVSVSRLVSWKRVERCISLFAAINRKASRPCLYRIVGDGDERPKLEAMVADLGLKDRVTFVGAVHHEQAVLEIKKAQVLFSMYDSSNVGNPLIESLAMGIPIATLQTGDTGTWITHGKNGFIWTPQELDFESWAEELIPIVDNPKKYLEFRKNVQPPAEKPLMRWDERMMVEIDVVGEEV